VKATASGGNPLNTDHGVARVPKHRGATYQRVCDERKRPIRGLWVRNGRYYAQITIEDQETGLKKVRRVPLENVGTAAQARDAMHELLLGRRKGQLPILKRTPTFGDFADQYLAFHRAAKDSKRSSTLKTEEYAINQWKSRIGEIRLNKISKSHVTGFIAARQQAGRSGRTVNLEVIVLRNVLKRAIDEQWLNRLPTENLRPLKWTPRKRELVAAEQIDKLCHCALTAQPGEGIGAEVERLNGRQFTDYVRFLAYSGARRNEALRVRWADLDWRNRQITIGADGQTKNHESRVVDLNAKLEAHLKDMESRRAPDSEWLFPSPRRGEQDRAAKTFVETMRLVRQSAGLPKFGFHDCRHFFISMCVMSGIDFMTIARWVGHKDGGILIGKVYGHLSNEHARRQAERIVFS
jgi:integrase